MCGLAGLLSAESCSAGDALRAQATAMAETLAHRGPDDAGVWADPRAGVALAHRRLSILDPSPAGRQPMASASGRYQIAFNGEIYNFRELRLELEGRGHAFRGHSDTEVVLAGVEEWGLEGALGRFLGMFAIALWDVRERVLHLVRDRLGEKPLYYARLGRTLAFGSELKALRAHPGWREEINREALTLYLRHGYVPAPYSIYDGSYKLPPGCVLSATADGVSRFSAFSPHPAPSREAGGLRPLRYWSARAVAEAGARDPLEIGDAEALERLEQLLRDAVGRQMVADVPVGALLSGGVDSSIVVALMQSLSDRPVRTYSVGFREAAYDESEAARAVARHLATEHTALCVGPEDALEVVPRLATLFDEPFADASQIPTFLVCRLAREDVTVTLSGDGGDELFGGYDRYARGERIWRAACRLPPTLRRAAAGGLRAVPPGILDRLLATLWPARFARWSPGEKLHKLAEMVAAAHPGAVYRPLSSHWNAPEAVVRGGFEPPTPFQESGGWDALPDFLHHMMLLDSLTYLPDDILVKLDRASMAVGLEARVPLLDHRVFEFAWRLPTSLKARRGRRKWLLRALLERHVPRPLVERPKMGFGVPLDEWLRGPLRDWAESLLAERRLRDQGFLEPGPIRATWREHLSRRADWQFHLWNVLVFQAWLESRKAAIPASGASSAPDSRYSRSAVS